MRNIRPLLALSALAVFGLATHPVRGADEPKPAKIKALLVDGQNNHTWKKTTPILKAALESSGLFTVDVATSPPPGQKMDDFRPDFSRYGVVISNYNGDEWPGATKRAFEDYVKNGGGFVSVHAADNSFPKWAEYNKMIGVGGWGGRSDKSGPLLRCPALSKAAERDVAPDARSLSGAAWWRANEAKYPNSRRVEDLDPDFRKGVEAFLAALKDAGATVEVASTRRSADRAYLMHYAWAIAHGEVKAAAVPARDGVPIRWDHGDEAKSKKAAEEMAKLFGMVHQASLKSRHISGKAIDMTIRWTGTLAIKDRDGKVVKIASSPRSGDNKELHAVGATYGVVKLASDPPHWSTDGK